MRGPRNIKIFGKDAVVINWLVLVTLSLVTITGAILLKEFIYHELDIFGGLISKIPHFTWTEDVHMYSGFGLLAVGLIHILTNLKNTEKELLPKRPSREVRDIIHTFMFILFLAKRDEMGNHGKYRGHQRIAYVMFVYIIMVLGLSTILMYIEPLHESGFLIHMALGVHLILIVLYRAVLHLRKRDLVHLKAYYMTGYLPEWYVRKYHFLWYKQLTGRETVEFVRKAEGSSDIQGSQDQDKVQETQEANSKEITGEVAA